ncbi:MAG: GIY-YIG nuclease family protein [Pseudomonadota bacterium]
MYYTYILKSISPSSQEKTYIGYTSDLKKRLERHNSGECNFTSKYTPWELQSYFAFRDKKTALNFEKYLKSFSGKAFANKHF